MNRFASLNLTALALCADAFAVVVVGVVGSRVS